MSVYAASIDDNDSQITYSDGWVLVTTDGDWKGTMHSTSIIGSFARVRFTGSRVAVVCTIPTGDGQLSQASFALDNAAAVQVTHATTPPVQWQTVFWDSGPLAFGSHLVVITNTGNTAYFRLDHIDYDPTSASSPTSSVGSGSGSGTTTVRSTLTSTVVIGTSISSDIGTVALLPSGSSVSGKSSQSVSSSSETGVKGSGTSSSAPSTGISPSSTNINDAASSGVGASSSTKSSPSTAGVVAGILGGLLGILLLVLVFLYLRRRRRRRALSNAGHLTTGSDNSHINPRRSGTTIPTPFGVNRGTSHEMSSTNPSLISPYGTLSPDSMSSPNSTSMYVSGSELSTLMGGQHQYQHLGAGAGGAVGSGGAWGNSIGVTGVAPRTKHAELMAEQQAQLVDTSIVSAPSGYPVAAGELGGDAGSTSVGAFQDAPPAYPGKG